VLAGNEVGHLKEKERTKARKGNIGFVFQSFNLIEEATGFYVSMNEKRFSLPNRI
jgi:putative ABC transport system ATP-binding protein